MADTPLLPIAPALLERITERCDYAATPDSIAAFAAAINHDAASPAGAARLSSRSCRRRRRSTVRSPRSRPADAWLSSVHGQHDLHIDAPIEPGMQLRSAVALHGVHARRSGTQMILRSRTEAAGRRVNEQYWTLFVRGHVAERDLGEAAPDHLIPEQLARAAPAGSATAPIDADQSYRYARASGDDTAYHVDEAAARAAGFDGVILHGLCTLALALGSLGRAAGFGDERVCRVAARFVRPVLPGGTLTSRYWRLDEGVLAFETADDAGTTAINHGRVELR